MKVLFLSPHYPDEMVQFVRALAAVGARVYGAGDVPREQLPEAVQRCLTDYAQVAHLLDERAVIDELGPLARNVGPDLIETLWEPCVLPAARLRDALGVAGLSYDAALGFRDKTLMKDRLAAAGLRVPRHARVRGAEQAMEAAERLGFPLVFKPVDGAGTRDTVRVDTLRELERLLPRLVQLGQANLEEFIDGVEHTYDALSIDGEPALDSVAVYFPPPLSSRTQEWISPAQIVFRDPHAEPSLTGGIALGRAVLQVLGARTGFTHMEWFRKADGEAVFGEIAARAPGGRLVEQMNYANDLDVYLEWANAVCFGRIAAQPSRAYHVATVFKRAQGQGRITGSEGLDALRARCGDALVVEALLPVGAARRDWHETLLSDGYVTIRHPDLATCRSLMDFAVSDFRIYAG